LDSHAAGIDEFKVTVFDGHGSGNAIARDPGCRIDNANASAREHIEQRRLADIRSTHYRNNRQLHRNTLLETLAGASGYEITTLLVYSIAENAGGNVVAKCDEGYPCEVCGEHVEVVTESDLYLRYILGEVLLESLHLLPERHVRCNPALAQYIVADDFPPMQCIGDFDKRNWDAEYVAAEERRVNLGWRRLQAIPHLCLSIPEYPLSITPADEA